MLINKQIDINKYLAPTSPHILEMFDSTEEEFTARTVQEGFKLAERNKLQKLVKTAEFWQGYKVNLTKLSVDFKAEFMKQNPKATKEENFKEFFQRLEKFSTK
jgi:hypothetical protein